MNDDTKVNGGNSCDSCPKEAKWRKDFPVEWESDHYVSRREMVKFLTLGSFFLAAANWITVLASKMFRRSRYPEMMIGSATTLDSDKSLLFRYPTDRDPCIAVKTPDGKLVAYSQVCTHLSCAVVYSKPENTLLCPCHKGSFNVIGGEPIGGPPTRPLPRILVEQRGNQIYATGVEV